MAKDGDEYGEDGFNKAVFEHEPTAKGGRRMQGIEPKPRGRGRNNNPNFQKNLKPWPRGTSGNQGGLPKNVREIQAMAREMTPEILFMLNELAHDPAQLTRDRIAAGIAVMDRGGRPPVLVATADMTAASLGLREDGEPMDALTLRAARANKSEERMLMELKAETRRLEAKIASDREEDEARHNGNVARLTRGEDVPALSRMLIQARAVKNAKGG